MSADPTAPSTTVAAPLSGRAAIAILGTMVVLILALTVILVQTTWASAKANRDLPAPAGVYDMKDLAQR